MGVYIYSVRTKNVTAKVDGARPSTPSTFWLGLTSS